MSLPSIETLDADGAIREAEDAVAGDTRAAFFRKAAVGGGAVLTSGAIMGMLPELATAKPSRKQDINILNFALTLEFLEAEFYKQAVTNGNLMNPQVRGLAELVADHESTHVNTLREALGSKAIKKPSFEFGDATTDEAKFLRTSFVLENTGVRAYLGQAGRLKSKKLLSVAGSIVTVEARHAAAFAILLGDKPFASNNKDGGITPMDAFDKPLSKSKVLAAAKPFIKS